MPTREILSQFLRDWTRLNPEQQEAFLAAVDKVVDDLRAGHGFRSGLRVKGVRGTPARDELHVIWRRIATHEISASRSAKNSPLIRPRRVRASRRHAPSLKPEAHLMGPERDRA